MAEVLGRPKLLNQLMERAPSACLRNICSNSIEHNLLTFQVQGGNSRGAAVKTSSVKEFAVGTPQSPFSAHPHPPPGRRSYLVHTVPAGLRWKETYMFFQHTLDFPDTICSPKPTAQFALLSQLYLKMWRGNVMNDSEECCLPTNLPPVSGRDGAG